jgi:hypothetical protein
MHRLARQKAQVWLVTLSLFIFYYFSCAHFCLYCSTVKARGNSLEAARPIDARAAAADDDAAVGEVRSRDATPPPSPTVADHLAALAANGKEMPGIGDEEILLEADGPDDALNVEANAEARAREETREQRVKKQAAKPVPPARTEKSRVPKPPRTKSDSDSETEVAPKAKRAKPARPTQQVVSVDSDDDDADASTNQSRHKPVKSSDIYKNWEARVPDLRRRYQVLMLVRDGFPCKTAKNYQELNYRLVLQAAKDTMDTTSFKKFKSEMDAAFNSTDRA